MDWKAYPENLGIKPHEQLFKYLYRHIWYLRCSQDIVLIKTRFHIVSNLAQNIHAALDVCNSRAVSALYCLLEVSRNDAVL
jgi:hypothetical protein